MICKNCGGQLPEHSTACSFCGAETCFTNNGSTGEFTDLEKRMAEILMDPCGKNLSKERSNDSANPTKAVTNDEPKPTWWKEDSCGGCGGGLTGTDKDLRYVFSIVLLIAGVIVIALALNLFL